MNIQLDEQESNIVKQAACEADAWHFNKYLVLIIVTVGFAVVLGRTIFEIVTAGYTGVSIANIIVSLAMVSLMLLWLKNNWRKTNKEKAVDMIYSKIKESA